MPLDGASFGGLVRAGASFGAVWFLDDGTQRQTTCRCYELLAGIPTE